MDKKKAVEKSKGFFAEFKTFIARGNVIDLAVGVIIGSAFSAITTSLVNDIIMPLLGIILGKINFSQLALTVGDATLTYGNFIQAIINFLVIAFAVFLMVKTINSFHRKKEAPAPEPEAAPEPAPEPEPSEEVKLLTEIRDALKNKN